MYRSLGPSDEFVTVVPRPQWRRTMMTMTITSSWIWQRCVWSRIWMWVVVASRQRLDPTTTILLDYYFLVPLDTHDDKFPRLVATSPVSHRLPWHPHDVYSIVAPEHCPGLVRGLPCDRRFGGPVSINLVCFVSEHSAICSGQILDCSSTVPRFENSNSPFQFPNGGAIGGEFRRS